MKELLATLIIMVGWIIIPGAGGLYAGFFLGLCGVLIAFLLAAGIGFFTGRIAAKILFN